MASVRTTRPINPSQLGVELGRKALEVVGPDPAGETIVRTRSGTNADLQAAVDAHVADPNWTDPDPPAPPAPTPEGTARARLAELRDVARQRDFDAGERAEAIRLVVRLSR